MGTPEGEKKIPEWHLFDRIDELEKITLELMDKTDTTEPTLKETSAQVQDAIMLAEYGVFVGVGPLIVKDPNPRLAKETFIGVLRKAGLSQKILGDLDASLTALCVAIEERQNK
jgi:hypothetical protein